MQRLAGSRRDKSSNGDKPSDPQHNRLAVNLHAERSPELPVHHRLLTDIDQTRRVG
jgi:hypothetical protein